MRITDELYSLTHTYRAKGGKRHRHDQIKRLKLACAWIDGQFDVGSLHRLGKRHVIAFWKSHRHLSDATLREYFYAFRVLWQLLQRAGDPPRYLHEAEFKERYKRIKASGDSRSDGLIG